MYVNSFQPVPQGKQYAFQINPERPTYSAHLKPKTSRRVKSLATAGGLFTAAVLLKRLPERPSAYTLIPTDWKQWAKAGLGIAGISQLNQGLDWKPPLWLGTLQTVTILTPLLQKLEAGWLRRFAILAPLITGLVQVNHWLSETVEGPLEEKLHVPPLVTQLAFSVLTTIVGMKSFPPLDKVAEKLFNRSTAKTPMNGTTQSATVATGITCARGCCASTVCLNEIGEYGGALFNWMKDKNAVKGQSA